VVGSLTDGRLYEDKPRAYRSSPLPAVRRLDGHSEPSPAEEKLLEKLYDTAVDGWRTLTDVRFKLLGLLPALSVIAWAALLREDGLRFGAGPIGGLIVGGAGLVVSIGIWIYDKRNNELYDDLISRARRIELEMGVDTGVFRGRLEPTRSFISHGTSTRVVYGTVVVGWILVMAWFGAILVDWVDPNALEAPTG
jgi:hypothetical protein